MKPEPYVNDHARSKRQKMARPKDLVQWFLVGFREEMPDDIHSHQVWRDYVPDQHLSSGGGSLLGTPRWSDPFRRFIEDDPFGVEASEYEGHKSLGNHYRTPMRAALARLAGRGTTEPSYFLSRLLWATACNDGDWNAAASHLVAYKRVAGAVVVDEDASKAMRRTVIEAALHRLYDRYHEEPPVYTVRESAA